ncbi:hypothetical protein Tco_1179411 [Tanacetum coccineum]
MLIDFVIQDQFFSYTLEEFGQIPGIPFRGQCSFFDKWSLDDLQFSIPTNGPYQTNPPHLDDIKLYIQEEWEGRVTRFRHNKVIDIEDNQILTNEIVSVMKNWVKIIRENVFCLGGNRDHVLACLCHMLYYIARSERYNLAYFIAKQMEFVTKQARLILPYIMLLTRLFNHVMSKSSELSNNNYVLYDRVIYPLTAQQQQKIRKDYGTRRGTSRASTPSPTHFVNSLSNDIPQIFSNPPNVDPNMEAFYSRQTEILNRQAQLRDEQHGGIMSIGKGIKNLLRGKKKE